MVNKHLAILGKNFILVLSGLFLLILSISSFFIRAQILLSNAEQGVFERNHLPFILLLLIFVAFLFFAKKSLAIFSEKKIFFLLSILYLSFGVYLIMNVDSLLRHDSLAVLSGANNFNKGDFSSLNPGNYLGMYPHQLGLTSFERIFLALVPSARILFFVNLLMVLSINFFQWKIVSLVQKSNSLSTKYVIVLSFLFLPQLFFILFVYGLIPGLFFLYVALYFMINYFKKRTSFFFAGNLLFIVLACLVRNNFIIAAIAMTIVYLYDFFKQKNSESIILAFFILAFPFASNNALTVYYEYTSGIIIDSAMPKTAYLAMGLQDDPSVVSFPGWYNGYHQRLYRESNGDVEHVNEQAKKDILDRFNYLKSHPLYTTKFFSKKLLSTWIDPTFQSIWSGPLESNQQYTHTKLLRSIYNGNSAYKILAMIMNAYLVTLFFLAFYKVIIALRGRKDVDYLFLFCCLYFLGGVFFHLFWETKSQYTYPYVFLLIPVACSSLTSPSKPNHIKMTE